MMQRLQGAEGVGYLYLQEGKNECSAMTVHSKDWGCGDHLESAINSTVRHLLAVGGGIQNREEK